MTEGFEDFATLAQRYWTMWGAPASAATSADLHAGMGGFREALEQWANAGGAGQVGFDNVLGYFKQQSGDWLGQMQRLAARFAGHDHSARDVVEAWREMLGDNPFQTLLDGMRGPGLEGIAQWRAMSQPWLRDELVAQLSTPTFGFAREHQQRMQAMGRAQLRWQAALEAYAALLSQISQDAYARFERKLSEREAPGLQIDRVRALFDLWVDAAEEAWADAALSLHYRQVFAELTNAQMQLRQAMQAQAEQTALALGLPGRTELDSAHRKIADLERQLRRLQQRLEDTPTMPVAKPDPVKAVIRKPAVKKAAVKKAAVKKSSVQKAPTGKAAVASKPAAKKPVAKSAAPDKTARKTAAVRKPAAKAAKPAMRRR